MAEDSEEDGDSEEDFASEALLRPLRSSEWGGEAFPDAGLGWAMELGLPGLGSALGAGDERLRR